PGLDLTTLVQQFQGLASGAVDFVTIPVVNSNAVSPTGQSIVQVDVPQVQRFMAALNAPPPSATTQTAAPPPAPPVTNEPTPPVSIDGVRCVD
ncbi:MAG TPA: LytR family transcriptional regulator, partial [Pseudonocardiaceae bacterium]|nr:LytR family transcriptional regulator [Pseudonocardiaceae bacterium]